MADVDVQRSSIDVTLPTRHERILHNAHKTALRDCRRAHTLALNPGRPPYCPSVPRRPISCDRPSHAPSTPSLQDHQGCGEQEGLAHAREPPPAPLLGARTVCRWYLVRGVNTYVLNVLASDMASSSDTPIAIVDDHDTDFFTTGMYPDESQAIFRDMLNRSYKQTLTRITSPSWTGSYIFDGECFTRSGATPNSQSTIGTYTRVAVYICLPPAAISNSPAAFASYTIDGTLQSTSYVPFTNSSLFIPRFAHFSSGLLLAIPGGHHNLTIQVSADPFHPYLLDYIVLWDRYLGPDHPYPGSPTYVSTFAQSSTPAVSTADQVSSSATLSLSGPVAFTSSTASGPGNTLLSASSAPPLSSPPAPYIVGAVVGSVAASAALLAMSYVMYRRHRKHGQKTTILLQGGSKSIEVRPAPTEDNFADEPDDPTSPLITEADGLPVAVGPLGAAESHPYDVPIDTTEGRYSTLVRHQTGKGKIKEIRLQPSQTGLETPYDPMPDTSASSCVFFEDASPDNLPLYSNSSAQAS